MKRRAISQVISHQSGAYHISRTRSSKAFLTTNCVTENYDSKRSKRRLQFNLRNSIHDSAISENMRSERQRIYIQSRCYLTLIMSGKRFAGFSPGFHNVRAPLLGPQHNPVCLLLCNKMPYFLNLYTYIESLPCPKEHKCGNHSVCVVDPLFPDKPDCKCDPNYKKSADGKRCEGKMAYKQHSLHCRLVCSNDQ